MVANHSQFTQDFDYYASYLDNSNLFLAGGFKKGRGVHSCGRLVAYNSSSISWSLSSHSSWTGAAYSGIGQAYFDVILNRTSSWTLTKTTSLQNFTDEDKTLESIKSQGFDILSQCKCRWEHLFGRQDNCVGWGWESHSIMRKCKGCLRVTSFRQKAQLGTGIWATWRDGHSLNMLLAPTI